MATTGIGSPSEVAQKKASSPHGATTETVVLPKQGVTPKRTAPRLHPGVSS